MVINSCRWPRLLFYSIVLAACILLANLAALIWLRDERFRLVLIDATYPLWGLLGTAGLLFGALSSRQCSHRLFLAWAMMALATLCSAVGDIVWAVLELSAGSTPFPSYADVFYLAFYPLFLAGLFWQLPVARRKPSAWLKTLLDMTIVLLAAALGLWHYLLGPLAAAVGEVHLLSKAVALAYPTGDVLLLCALLTLLYNGAGARQQRPLLLLALSIGVLMIADSIYGYQVLAGAYVSAGLLDALWIASNLILAIAGVWQATSVWPENENPANVTGESAKEPNARVGSWLIVLPYAGAAGAYLVMQQRYADGAAAYSAGLVLVVGIIIGLVLVRQIVTIQENHRLFEQVRQQGVALWQANQELQVEIEERKRAERQLAHDALHDALTGLPNRILFMDRLRHALIFARRNEAHRCAVLFLDLDYFKVINDSLGHRIGDQLLIAVTQRLRLCLRPGDTVGRLGGDEFVVLLEETEDETEVVRTAANVLEQLQSPIQLDKHQVFITASIGVVTNAQNYDRPEEILRDADIALYHAKARGRACYELFSAAMGAQARKRLEMESELRHALEHGELEVSYQPILSLRSDSISGFEALLRWRHPKYGLIPPGEFIPLMEETGLIVAAGQWVLREACRQVRDWQVRFPRNPPLTMSVNISATQFMAPNFVEHVAVLLQEFDLDPATLHMELTEGIWLNTSAKAMRLFKQLSALGVQFHIDDFGTGYSSLAYLQSFPIQTIKIDRSFVSKLGSSSNSIELVRAVIVMARDLGMETVAEGVETAEQLNSLKELGCNYGQGYLFSRPVNQQGIEKLLTDPLYGVTSQTQPFEGFELFQPTTHPSLLSVPDAKYKV